MYRRPSEAGLGTLQGARAESISKGDMQGHRHRAAMVEADRHASKCVCAFGDQPFKPLLAPAPPSCVYYCRAMRSHALTQPTARSTEPCNVRDCVSNLVGYNLSTSSSAPNPERASERTRYLFVYVYAKKLRNEHFFLQVRLPHPVATCSISRAPHLIPPRHPILRSRRRAAALTMSCRIGSKPAWRGLKPGRGWHEDFFRVQPSSVGQFPVGAHLVG